MPDSRQYRGLVDRLSTLARGRLHLTVCWVSRYGNELSIEVHS